MCGNIWGPVIQGGVRMWRGCGLGGVPLRYLTLVVFRNPHISPPGLALGEICEGSEKRPTLGNGVVG